jgi:hypothetical protein
MSVVLFATAMTACMGGGRGSKTGAVGESESCDGGVPQMTVTLIPDDDGVYIAIGGSGTATIDWGDGSPVETCEFTDWLDDWGNPGSDEYNHAYSGSGERTVTVTGNEVTRFFCGGNRVTALDVSRNVALTMLGCSSTQLESLDVSRNVALTSLACSFNKLTELDVSRNTELVELHCQSNRLTALDVSRNTALELLDCHSNQITALDIRRNIALRILSSGGNPFANVSAGSCGDNLVWMLHGDTLTIRGSGEMTDYDHYTATPWYGNTNEIKTLTLPDGLTTVGSYAFHHCTTGLTSVVIPSAVTEIGESAFENCTYLTSVTIPASVNKIGENAFMHCVSLTAFTVEDGNAAYCSEDGVLFNRSQTVLIQYPASREDAAYTVPATVTAIGNNAFYTCRLKSAVIPSAVTKIGEWAFYGSALTSVVIGSSVTSIGGNAFLHCEELTEIYNHATTPQTIKTNRFEDVDKSACTLYVPAASVEAYKTAHAWKDFINIKAIEQ